LRAEKNRLQEEIESLFASSAGVQKEDSVLTYKETVLCNSLANMREILPELRGVDAGRLEKAPVFTKSFDGLVASLSDGKRLGVVGGPCLLGTGEMEIRVEHRDGSSICFDFNTRNYRGDLRDSDAVGPYIRKRAGDIVKILFENKKEALSLQDNEFRRMPVEFACLLDAPVVIPLPDAAYAKYVDAIVSPAAPEVRAAAKEEFAVEIRRVSKLFLDAIEDLMRRLRPPRLEILHIGDEDGLSVFYEGRKPYLDRVISPRSGNGPAWITKEPNMLESVKDYVFYPALPFYFWGTENVLQVDSLNETDSVRKCASAHGSGVSFFSVLYPEMLDRTASRAMSMAPAEDKVYT
jgi:hypothetical protein